MTNCIVVHFYEHDDFYRASLTLYVVSDDLDPASLVRSLPETGCCLREFCSSHGISPSTLLELFPRSLVVTRPPASPEALTWSDDFWKITLPFEKHALQRLSDYLRMPIAEFSSTRGMKNRGEALRYESRVDVTGGEPAVSSA